jgi:uncharacterized damage-inducible protein DinB
MTVLTADELIAWVEQTSTGWRTLLSAHPEALAFPSDIRESKTLADVVQHIVAVELRYAERLGGLVESSYETLPKGGAEELFATHDRAVSLLRELLSQERSDWDSTMEFSTRSAGVLRATRRTVLAHLLLHSVRHYAQLATIVRQHGIKPDWGMDYLFMGTS